MDKKAKTVEMRFDLRDVLGGDFVLTASDVPETDVIPLLTGIYIKGQSVNLLQMARADFVHLLCDRFSINYIWPSRDRGLKDWNRLVRQVTQTPKAK
jgi:hypothetical protein